MNKPEISNNFTVDDIHKVREYNHEATKNMSFVERKKYYDTKANEFKKLLRRNDIAHEDYTAVNEIRAIQK